MKTKRNLNRAFAALLRKKSVEKITVSELCEEAEICNSTFYTHFSSIDDFILKMKSKIINEFLLIVKSIYSQMGEDMLKVKDLLAYIDKNRKLFLSISSNDGFCQKLFRCPKEFADSFFDLIQKDYESIFDDKIAFEFVCYCAWGALFSPFEDAEASTSRVFRLAYVIFLTLFQKKEKSEEAEA